MRRRVLRTGPVSLLIRPRVIGYLLAATVVLAALTVVSIGAGDFPIPPRRVLDVLGGTGTAAERLIIGLRVPRTLLAVVVGAALGLAGAVVQRTARNDLASPDLLGVTGGAGVGAVTVIVLADTTGQGAIAVAATLGALVAAAAMLGILRHTGIGGSTPILVGIGVSTLLSGIVAWLLTAADVNDLARAQIWLTGSLNLRSTGELIAVTAVLAVATVALVPLSSRLAALSLGTDVARALGVPVKGLGLALLLICVLLTAATTAAAGPIAFVSLVAPHLARMATGTPAAGLLTSAVTGATLLLAGDLIARTAFVVQLPTGAVTALIGAPFLIWLLVRART
ncbi:FecCD family ABC transporter permease [Actinoplanes rectilineatus]|uniref:FecCD family ABC transporter permease n=1 Tax=Actinoplanes rectilineatus TaxID=113571 RepID=UPI0005F2FB19|nr:iron ABC transporter permease [Actinoplanes rectilineatus]